MDRYVILPDAGLRDINPVEYGDERCAPDKGRTRTVREYYLLHYVCSGKGRFTTGDRVYDLSGGQMFVVHPYETVFYEPDPADPWHYCWVGFDTVMDLPALRDVSVTDAGHAEHIFRSIGMTDRSMRGCAYYIAGKVMELLSALAPVDGQESDVSFVDSAVEYIRRNYNRPITVDDLAAQLHVSHSYFSTMFRQQTGMAPYQYLLEVRLRRAAELIAEHGCSVTEAAVSVGYGNIFNFSKMFKKRYGVSPSRYVADRGSS
ncbi:MAG: AraC family transcriptional regulator [Acutalibacteraceae bacterium]|jgi:AraC-like DNA-binding protein